MIAYLFIAASNASAAQSGGAVDIGPAFQAISNRGAPACGARDAETVVVCGRRTDRYRIDRDVLRAARAKNANSPKPSPNAQAMTQMRYGNSQDVGRIIPTDVRQMPVGKAVIAAVNGGDWRDGFAGPPSAYEVLEAEKAATER